MKAIEKRELNNTLNFNWDSFIAASYEYKYYLNTFSVFLLFVFFFYLKLIYFMDRNWRHQWYLIHSMKCCMVKVCRQSDHSLALYWNLFYLFNAATSINNQYIGFIAFQTYLVRRPKQLFYHENVILNITLPCILDINHFCLNANIE